MTRPTDAEIAWAFWELYERLRSGFIDADSAVILAAQFDAESPAGTERGSEEVMRNAGPDAGQSRGQSKQSPVALVAECKTATFTDPDEYMCPNCLTPWRCNGPHIPERCQCETCSPEVDAVARGEEGKTSPLSGITINESPCIPKGMIVVSQDGEVKGIIHSIPTEPAKRTCTRPACRAEMRPGLRCSSPHCGLKGNL